MDPSRRLEGEVVLLRPQGWELLGRSEAGPEPPRPLIATNPPFIWPRIIFHSIRILVILGT